MGKKIELYRWRVLWLERWVTTKHYATREQILIEHPEAVPIPGTRIEREEPSGQQELSTGRFYSGWKDSQSGGVESASDSASGNDDQLT